MVAFCLTARYRPLMVFSKKKNEKAMLECFWSATGRRFQRLFAKKDTDTLFYQ